VKEAGINYTKKKKASSNYNTKQCKKKQALQRMIFKGTITISLKLQSLSLGKNCQSFALNQAVRDLI
jgi:hypothetical protein